ncbi:TRAP transporter large permease subunit, partial [Piscinibacter sp.]|uniref:TRAP transporter large permease subunit n=1 Tax=Piscinibacter sp. TaxID=1903157 RepID=UPI003784C36A
MSTDSRSLVLSLILGAEARGDAALGVRELISACALFELPENNVRVALARAVAAGQLATPRRGAYALSAQSRPLADEVGRWRSLEDQIVEWRGDWLAVHVGATGRSDRPALRARERAFGKLIGELINPAVEILRALPQPVVGKIRGACAGFGAVCGSSVATTATFGRAALPELRRYGTQPGFATGTIAVGGVLGILIPPSVILVVYAISTEQNIAKLFMAALI